MEFCGHRQVQNLGGLWKHGTARPTDDDALNPTYHALINHKREHDEKTHFSIISPSLHTPARERTEGWTFLAQRSHYAESYRVDTAGT